ncbi:MAG TPA: DNA replication/repair protein RecF [Acidimicrobiales bacterium]|nr:DNA replication/repair protein RecF [Acidimicrobiales bacterium]
MAITRLWLTDFRCFTEACVEPDPHGLTVLRGPNGAGKTSVLEAVGWLATQRSLRGAPRDVLVRTGAARAVLRAETLVGERRILVEAELPATGMARTQVNRQPVRRRADLVDAVRVTVFSPDDLDLVQEGPSGRRDYLDEVLVDRHRRFELLTSNVERVLRQRASVLRQAGHRLDADIVATLDVWDDRLATSGSELADARDALVAELAPLVSAAYGQLAGSSEPITLTYRRSWEGDLADALSARRSEDLRRQITTVGPQRDELEIAVGPGPARTHASQGEQRCVALALRLATHELRRRATTEPPVLLLDDVFSELDARRSSSLVEQLPAGQVLLTTAVDPPAAVTPDRVVRVEGGTLSTGMEPTGTEHP